jgi:curli biogenesis system outer membrane secretion channel CsgG
MKKLIGAVLLGSAIFTLPAMAQTNAAPPVKCRVAEVNPVTNHAHCIDPIGATLDPQAASPCQGMHQTGQWTMSNGCDAATGSSAN